MHIIRREELARRAVTSTLASRNAPSMLDNDALFDGVWVKRQRTETHPLSRGRISRDADTRRMAAKGMLYTAGFILTTVREGI